MKRNTPTSVNQLKLLLEYFEKNPNRSIRHPEIVDWAVKEYGKRSGKVFRDPDRGIRRLHQDGLLIKVGKGVYKYDPQKAKEKKVEGFSAKTRGEIFIKDGYKCVICGHGEAEGVEIHADHIKPLDRGGKSTLDNGQTLCGAHNYLKKNLNQTETGKKMFIRLLELAKKDKNTELEAFSRDVLELYGKHNINGHIEWVK